LGARNSNSAPAQSATVVGNSKTNMYFALNKINSSRLLLSALVLCILCTPVQAQKKNRSERYVDAYKKYLNASCPAEKDSIQHFVYFAKDTQEQDCTEWASINIMKLSNPILKYLDRPKANGNGLRKV
jgi:hypothetical protein